MGKAIQSLYHKYEKIKIQSYGKPIAWNYLCTFLQPSLDKPFTASTNKLDLYVGTMLL